MEIYLKEMESILFGLELKTLPKMYIPIILSKVVSRRLHINLYGNPLPDAKF